jgi:hypothetical protein
MGHNIFTFAETPYTGDQWDDSKSTNIEDSYFDLNNGFNFLGNKGQELDWSLFKSDVAYDFTDPNNPTATIEVSGQSLFYPDKTSQTKGLTCYNDRSFDFVIVVGARTVVEGKTYN